jgi:hypothetical protein
MPCIIRLPILQQCKIVGVHLLPTPLAVQASPSTTHPPAAPRPRRTKTMEPGSCSRLSWADEVKANEASRGAASPTGFNLPPLAATAHAAFMLQASSLDPDALSPSLALRVAPRRDCTSPIQRPPSATLRSSLRRLVARRSRGRVGSADAVVAALAGALSWRMRAALRLRQGTAWRPLLCTPRACQSSRTPRGLGR